MEPFVLFWILSVRVPSSTIDTSAEFVFVKMTSAHSTHPKVTLTNNSMLVLMTICCAREE